MRKFSYKKTISVLLSFAVCLQLFSTAQVNAFDDGMSKELEAEGAFSDGAALDSMEETDGLFGDMSNNEEAVAAPWEVIDSNGGAKTPYAFGPDISYGDSSDAIASMDLLKEWLNSLGSSAESIVWSEDGSRLLSMPLADGAQLILLSVTDPRVYQNTDFLAVNNTDGISLVGTVGSSELTFQGLGSDDFPFQGSFPESSFIIDRTLFRALDYSAAGFADNTLTIKWMGEESTGAIVASKLVSSEGKMLTVDLTRAYDDVTFFGSVFDEIFGDLDLTISFDKDASFENKVIGDWNNAGMVVNTVSDGTLALTVSSFPGRISIDIDGTEDDKKSNAGLLVGYLKEASLTLNGSMVIPEAIVQAAQGGAGGIVGRVEHSTLSEIRMIENVDLSRVTVVGKYSGGIAGYAGNVAVTFGENGDRSFTLPQSIGQKEDNLAAGSGETSVLFGYLERGNDCEFVVDEQEQSDAEVHAEETTEDVTEENIEEVVEETAEESGVTLNAGGSVSESWEVITSNGGPKAPYAFGPGVIYGEGENSQESMELLKSLLESYHKSQEAIAWSDDNNLTSMPLDDGAQLVLLSMTDPQVYQNTAFKTGSITGQISLNDSVGDIDLTFQGLGSESYPFRGSFANSSFTVNRTLFNSLDYSVANFSGNTLTVDWMGESSTGAIVATRLTGDDGKMLTVNINSSKSYSFRDAAFGEISGDLVLTISFDKNASFENKVSDNPNNAGMVANTVSSGTLTLTVSSFPRSITIGINGSEEKKNNAGLLVGYLVDSALTLNGVMTPQNAVVQAAEGGAGGIVGKVTTSDTSGLSNITLNDNIDLTNVKILGKYTGGIAGYAENVAFSFGTDGDKTFTLPASLGEKANNIVGSGDVSSWYTGGIFGWYSMSNGNAYAIYDGKGFFYPIGEDAPITLHANTGSGEAGALFGRLNLENNCVFLISGTEEKQLTISCNIEVADSAILAAGTLAGKLVGASTANELKIAYTAASIKANKTDKIQFQGGLVGVVETAALDVQNVNITATQPSVSQKYGFGGLVGQIKNKSVLETTENVTITTSSPITRGGGLVGEAQSGSVVRLSGVTDLRAVTYTAPTDTSVFVGQLVGKQENALVFATGSGNGGNWTYRRSQSPARVDDIGNYGQVIRLGDNLSSSLISIDGHNTVRFMEHDEYGTISSADDFALHAIAFATADVFGIYPGQSNLNYTNVKLTADVNLSGTGIQGLTPDNGSKTFDGQYNGLGVGVTFDGGNHTLTINTGELYGLRNGSAAEGEGSGQCYRHGCYGLLGKVNSAVVKDLTIEGTMNIGADVNTYAGFVFGYVDGGYSGGGAVNTLENVTVTDTSSIHVDGGSNNNGWFGYVGGFIGYVAGKNTGISVKASNMNAEISYYGTYDSVILGGVLAKDNYQDSIDLSFDDVTVSGSITSNITSNAHVGGLVGDITAYSKGYRGKIASMSLKNVVVTSEISNSAGTTSGGLLGYYWDNVDVTFDGRGENYAVTTNGASITTGGASAGGLCFAATGRWNMQKKAVDMGSATITNAGDLGLLVCHGERQAGTPGQYSDGDNAKALYLVMDTEWETAYRNENVSVTGNHYVFDEVVAYTASKDNGDYDITLSDAGIISLHTRGGKLNMTSGERNTYINRTAYGQVYQTNPNSRYYYNLDTINIPIPAGEVDTPSELLIWSVRKYCAGNILSYLPEITSDMITGTLDMDGYSYYPVNVANTDVSVKNAFITFYNEKIEVLETADPRNKSTIASEPEERTQHFSMHSGLLYDYYTDRDASAIVTLEVTNLTLLGTVGMVGSASGALLCGKIYGYSGTYPAKLELNTLKVDRDNEHLSVSDFNTDYAPLLINGVGSFATLNISGVTAETAAAGATSLIGNVGDANTQGINLSFSKMKLPDTAGRFTKATMIHRLYYFNQNNSAVYNFTKEEDWDDTEHIHQVTYGKEIGGTVEYAESASNPHQYYYAQSKEYVSHTGQNFMDGGVRDSFDSYLPYVATGYNSGEGYHELQVNSSLKDIVNGCGTYGDPYQISEPEELLSIATFLSTGSASKNWSLNIPEPGEDGNSMFCSGESGTTHKTYVYDGNQWAENNNGKTLTNDMVLAYLQNAYYMITDSMTVSNFVGIGTRAKPFRGVVVGKTGGETITLEGTLPKGFIICSYGSVVKNLNLVVNGATNVSFTNIQDNSGYTSDSYYGGVIGCILGGDNIIDSVSVTYSETASVSLGSTKPYLIPVGGYVGVISGGGVIFRGNNSLSGVPGGYVNNNDYFYANKYVGRVLQGFAVQEGDYEKLDNSEKNYQICQLNVDNTSGISVESNTITLSDAQALLVLSSITNSGGAGNGTLLPYFNGARTYWSNEGFSAVSLGGKVRNASYNAVGSTTTESEDYKKSLTDDYSAVSETNTSYLDTHYAGGTLYNFCGDTDYGIKLANDTYDMTVYGNGFRSISPRYLANAVCNSATDSTVNYERLNPLISSVDGNGARIQTNITVKEYVDDENHAIAVGGVFNTVRFTNAATFRNVTIGGTGDDSRGTISHEYFEYDSTKNTWVNATHKNWNGKSGFSNLSYEQGRGLIAVGGFAGNSAAESGDKPVTFQYVNTQYLDIKGPFDAGGIIGHTGFRVTSAEAAYQTDSKNYHICYLTGKGEPLIVPAFQNCSYENLRIDGGMMVGGYVGMVAYKLYAPLLLTSEARRTDEVMIKFDEMSDGKLGTNSSIICRRPKTDSGIDASKRINSTSVVNCLPATGGLVGCSSLAVKIDNTKRATIENVEVRSSRSAGGVIAWAFSNVTIKNLSVIGRESEPNQIGDLREYKNPENNTDNTCEFAGGIVGYFEGSEKSLVVENCTVENLLVVASLRSNYPSYAAGIAANIYSNTNHVIANCKVENLKLANDNVITSVTTICYEGGLVGRLQSGNLYGSNLLVDSIQYAIGITNDRIGNLLGQADSGKTVYLAGVSIQNTRVLDTVLQTDIGGTKPVNCYVAYADYTGTAQDAGNAGNLVSGSSEPYVVTSPQGVEIPIGAADENGESPTMYLYGDGATPGIVSEIYDERGMTDKKKFYYSAAKDSTFETKYCSTFYAEMGLNEETAKGIPDFPVLQVPVAEKAAVSDEIVDYLNLVTNNGYSTARNTTVGASTHVTFAIDLYRWNSAGFFEKNPSGADKAFSGSGNDFETSPTKYDSGKNQFELLTVTFTETVSISGTNYSYKYNVQVPIVVRRMLEVDFTATLKDSPSFKASDYEVYNTNGFKPNITVGYGSSVSALLTYTYNTAFGEKQDYNWQFHLDNGGFMGDPGQAIQFYHPNSRLKSLPTGTQLILLDCADNNKAYRYLVNGQSESTGTNIRLSAFKDTDGAGYSARWLSEIMGVTAAQSDTGEWVLLDDSTGAQARIRSGNGYQYFRPKTELDTDTSKRYHLTVATDQPTEQFYLVIYIPLSSVEGIPETSETEGKNLNGYISTALPGLVNRIACNINSVRVKSDSSVVTDPHSSSESTYNFLSGYVQSLSDESLDKTQKLEGDPEAYVLLSEPEADGNYLLHMDLVDEITVVRGQKDTAETPLYFKENISLSNYARTENDAVRLVAANGFPTGCYGTVEFYVYTKNDIEGEKNYYKWTGETWVPADNEEKALSYEWSADGGKMELYLGTENTKEGAVSLAAVRQLAKNGNEKFYVETKMDIHMSVPAAEQVIAGAITKGNAYTKLSYTTYLASGKDGFLSTNYVESRQGEVRYFQSRSGSSTITHSANDPSQLGINCSDLASANGVIFTTGVYDLTTLSNAEKLIQKADKVTYTLTLWQRQQNGEYMQITENLQKYIRSVRMDDRPVAYSAGYQWTDKKSDGAFVSIDPENGKRFLLPVRVQVNTDVEANGVTFANYQLRLTATLYEGNEILDQPVNAEIQKDGKTEFIRYDYVTYTITRLLTSGYWGN